MILLILLTVVKVRARSAVIIMEIIKDWQLLVMTAILNGKTIIFLYF